MRKLLLATTAIAGVGLLAGEAAAQTGGPLKLGVGGYFQAYGWAGFGSSDPGQPEAHRRNFDFKREAEIHFLGETKLDNGLIVGAQVELEAETCADQIDESYLWFQGNWGRLLLGSTNSAAYKLSVGAPAIDGNYDGQDPNYRVFRAGTSHPRLGGPAQPMNIDQSVMNMSSDSEKITWLSPRVANLRMGVSYTPTNSEEASAGQAAAKLGSFSGFATNNCTATNSANLCAFPSWSDIIAVALNHEGVYGPVNLQAFVGYEHGFLQSDPSPALVGQFNDRNSYSAGVDIGLAGFHFGGHYVVDDNGSKGLENSRAWALGANYTIGPLTVGGSYMQNRQERASGAAIPATSQLAPGFSTAGNPTPLAVTPISSEKLDRIVAGARYVIGPGIDLRGTYQYYGYRNLGGATNDYVNAFVFGTNVRF